MNLGHLLETDRFWEPYLICFHHLGCPTLGDLLGTLVFVRVLRFGEGSMYSTRCHGFLFNILGIVFRLGMCVEGRA